MRYFLVWCLSAYQYLVSPLYCPCCRFIPSCSEYARQAILSHGVMRGTAFALRRIVRCNPLCTGGYDPVPSSNLSQRDSH